MTTFRLRELKFRLHSSILSAKSNTIKKRIGAKTNGDFTIPILETSLETFDCFVKWAYSDKPWIMGLDVGELKEAGQTSNITMEYGPDFQGCSFQKIPNNVWYSRLDHQNRVYGRLVDASIFGQRYQCPDFRKAATLQFQRCIYNSKIIPGAPVVTKAVMYLFQNAGLLQYLTICYRVCVATRTISLSGNQASAYMQDFLDAVRLSLAATCLPQVHESWCTCHEHKDISEIKECEQQRENDPDVCISKQGWTELTESFNAGRYKLESDD